ncbi:MAG: PadR family transcriptional regulator [Acidimicrobiales bacterium]|nr:PadR family transcriptional regulator [Acidimicrobiales bacterium]
MSSIRLLVLGVVDFAQPVHGYDVRRELQGWRLDGWVNVQPGSIYSALKTLERDGFIATVAPDSTEPTGTLKRPERTEYVMTAEGDTHFRSLLRAAWWKVERGQEPFFPAMCFLTQMSREELIAALQARTAQMEAQVAEMKFIRSSIRDGDTGSTGGIPEHVRENIDFAVMRTRADMEWSRQFMKRLRDGEYVLAGEAAEAGSTA